METVTETTSSRDVSSVQDRLDALALERREVERRRQGAQAVLIEANARLRQIAVEDRALRGAAG